MRIFVPLLVLAAAAWSRGQTAPAPAAGEGGPSVGYLYMPGYAPPANTRPTTTAEVFAGMKMAPPPEQRTSAQLQAVLESYLGRWVGQLDLFVVNGHGVVMRSTVPIEMNYTEEKRTDGRLAVKCVLVYILEGKETTEVTTRWVADGKIVSEFLRGERSERHVAITRGPSLVWFAEISGYQPTDYGVTETLRLTPDGGTLTMNGYMRLPGTQPPQLMHLSGELKQVPAS